MIINYQAPQSLKVPHKVMQLQCIRGGFPTGIISVARIIVELIPKYYVTPRTIPVVRPDGTRDYQKINQQAVLI